MINPLQTRKPFTPKKPHSKRNGAPFQRNEEDNSQVNPLWEGWKFFNPKKNIVLSLNVLLSISVMVCPYRGKEPNDSWDCPTLKESGDFFKYKVNIFARTEVEGCILKTLCNQDVRYATCNTYRWLHNEEEAKKKEESKMLEKELPE